MSIILCCSSAKATAIIRGKVQGAIDMLRWQKMIKSRLFFLGRKDDLYPLLPKSRKAPRPDVNHKRYPATLQDRHQITGPNVRKKIDLECTRERSGCEVQIPVERNQVHLPYDLGSGQRNFIASVCRAGVIQNGLRMGDVLSVSYTHLDVYKRQSIYIVTIRMTRSYL